jgi:hypothetical protein
MGRAIRAREDAAVFGTATGVPVGAAQSGVDEQAAPAETPQAILANRFLVQFATPDADAFDAALTGVRGTPGVRSLSVTSTAMGGSSVMNVSFEGSAAELADALRARGFAVNRSGNTLAISR